MDDLARWIQESELPPGDRLPAEADLALQFSVHRLTVRQALAELARAGTIRTVHGRGSFVAERPFRFRVTSDVPSIVALMRDRGMTVTQTLVGSTVVGRDDLPEPRDLADDKLLRLDTVLAVDGQPWSRASTWLSQARFGPVAAVWTPMTSLTGLLNEAYGIVVRRAWRRYSAERATAEDAAALGVAAGSPLLVQAGLNTDSGGQPLLQVVRRSRGDRLEYEVSL